MILYKKWIVMMMLSTFLWSENNETNMTQKIGILEAIGDFFGVKDKEHNASNEDNASIELNSTSTLHTDSVNKDNSSENNETNRSDETSIFDTISAFFTTDENNESNETTLSTIKEKTTKSVSKDVSSAPIDRDRYWFDGVWHLRVLDGMDVRKARSIIRFSISEEMFKFTGFDSCNRITGIPKASSNTTFFISSIHLTRMACRGKVYRWVSKRVRQTFKEHFTIQEEERYGMKGIVIKSSQHELFFKKMGEE